MNFNKLKKVPEKLRNLIITDLIHSVGRDIKREAIEIDDLKKIAANPLITIGSHTDSHVICTNCSEDELKKEIETANRKFSEWIDQDIEYFAYPNGDFNEQSINILKKYKIKMAFTIENRLVGLDDHLLKLPRTDMMNDGSFVENLCHILGIWYPFINRLK